MSDPFGAKATKKAAEAQGEATELQRKRENLASARNRRDRVREARQVQAETIQAAAARGVQTSSAAQGGLGSLKSQFSSNLSFLDNQNRSVDQESLAVGRVRKFEAKANRAKARLGLVLKGGSLAVGFI